MTASPEDNLARRCLAEIDDLHRFFVAWLGGDAAAELARCEWALGPGFQIVEPDGTIVEREPLLQALGSARGKHNDPDRPFSIRIEDATARAPSGALCLVTYVERQIVRGQSTARRSTALFRNTPDGPNGVEWLHVHETWIATGIATGSPLGSSHMAKARKGR